MALRPFCHFIKAYRFITVRFWIVHSTIFRTGEISKQHPQYVFKDLVWKKSVLFKSFNLNNTEGDPTPNKGTRKDDLQ